MTTTDFMVVAGAVLIAALVYMVVGFGFGLLVMPAMTLVVPVEQAVVIAALLAAASTWWQAIALRRDADRHLAIRMGAASVIGMPVGLVLLNVVDDRALRVALGVGVLIATLLLVRDLTLSQPGPKLDYSMGFLSGVLNTSIGTNGPPIVFNLQSRSVAPHVFRGTIAVIFAVGNLVSLSLFIADGKVNEDGVRAAAYALPCWLVGSLVGRRLRPAVPLEHFRTLVLGLLVVSAFTAIAAAL